MPQQFYTILQVTEILQARTFCFGNLKRSEQGESEVNISIAIRQFQARVLTIEYSQNSIGLSQPFESGGPILIEGVIFT